MAMIQGEHTCIYCGKTFKWYYTVRENLGSARTISVHQIPNNASIAFVKFSHISNKNELQAHCKYCDKYNIIDEDDGI